MIDLFYFTGTGNSLEVAREIGKELGGCEPIPILAHIDPEKPAKFSGRVLLVFPAYLMTLPYPVRRFLSVNDFSAVEYLAAVSTGQNKNNVCGITIDRALKKQRKKLDRYAEIQMPANTPVGLRPTKGDADWVEKVSGPALQDLLSRNRELCKTVASAIASDIDSKVVRSRGKEPHGRRLLEALISGMSKNNTTVLPYYSDETCTGCGVCSRVCPTNRISVRGNGAEWDKLITCYYCFACFNFCPQQAILLKNWNRKDGRYVNPNVGIEDLCRQKDPGGALCGRDQSISEGMNSSLESPQ